MREFIIFETFMFLNHEDLLNACIVNKSFNSIYSKYYEHFCEHILINNKDISYIKTNESSTLRVKNYAYSYNNKFDKRDMFFIFLKHLKHLK